MNLLIALIILVQLTFPPVIGEPPIEEVMPSLDTTLYIPIIKG